MAVSHRSRYGHLFSKGKCAVAFHGHTTMRGKPPASRSVTAMPHPENRPPYQVSPDLPRLLVAEIIEQGMRIKISCDNCHHETVWTRAYMERRLRKQLGLTVVRLAARLRCGGCRSEYVHISRG